MSYSTFYLTFEVLCLVSVGLGLGGKKETEHEKQHSFEVRTRSSFFSPYNTKIFIYLKLSNYYQNIYLIGIYHHCQMKTVIARFVVTGENINYCKFFYTI